MKISKLVFNTKTKKMVNFIFNAFVVTNSPAAKNWSIDKLKVFVYTKGRYGEQNPFEWPLKYPDLTPLDLYLLGRR